MKIWSFYYYYYYYFTNYLLHYLLFHVRLSLLVPEGLYEAEMLMSKVEHQCKDVFPITQKERQSWPHGLLFSSSLMGADVCCLD